MKIRHLLWILFGALGISCSQNDLFIPSPDALPFSTPIPRNTLRAMEGIYKLTDGATGLGVEFVCKTSRNKVSFFSNTRGIFMIFDAAVDPSDSSVYLAGFWRVSENSSGGAVSFKIPRTAGGHDLMKFQIASAIEMTGRFTAAEGNQELTISYDRDFSAAVKARPIVVFGHHGIQTNANPPFIENSIECFYQAQDYGANGLEVDVRLTKDNIPVLLHDVDLNLRVMQKNGILADLNAVNYNALQALVRLIDGQRVPSVERALRVAIDSTELEYVWLDVKGNVDVFKYVEPIVRAAVNHARDVNRNIVIITDIPSTSVLQEFYKYPFAGLPLMYEPELETTIALGAGYWGPRWTLGTLNDQVAKAHSLGIKVFSWTANSESVIVSFLNNGDFDGMITDYPAYVIYHYYTR